MEDKQLTKLRRSIRLNNILIFVLFGVILNMLVITSNDMNMPVFYFEEEKVPNLPGGYVAFSDFDDVNLPLFSDILRIPQLRFSIGDAMFCGGLLLYILVYLKGFYDDRRFNGTIGKWGK